MFPGGIVLLMVQEPDPAMQEDEPSAIVKGEKRLLMAETGLFLIHSTF